MKKTSILLVLAIAAMFASCCDKNACDDKTNETTVMNTTMDDLLTRRSVRSYTDEVPPIEVIEEICKAGTYAPTGMNRQAPIIVAVTNREVRDRLSKLNAGVFGRDDMDPFYGAPVVLVVLADTTAAFTWKEDGSLVMGNLLNAAHAKASAPAGSTAPRRSSRPKRAKPSFATSASTTPSMWASATASSATPPVIILKPSPVRRITCIGSNKGVFPKNKLHRFLVFLERIDFLDLAPDVLWLVEGIHQVGP